MGQSDLSGRPTIVAFTDSSLISLLENLKLQSLTDFRDQCNGPHLLPEQILFRIRPAPKMAMNDLLIQDGVTGYNAEAKFSWQSSISSIEVINHFINLDISSGNPGDAVLTALRNVVIKFDSYDK